VQEPASGEVLQALWLPFFAIYFAEGLCLCFKKWTMIQSIYRKK